MSIRTTAAVMRLALGNSRNANDLCRREVLRSRMLPSVIGRIESSCLLIAAQPSTSPG
jgi:hypothetical protein